MMDPNQFGTMLGGGANMSPVPQGFFNKKPVAPGGSGGAPAAPAMPVSAGDPMSILPPGGIKPMPPKPHPWSAEAVLGKPPAPPQLPAWLGGPGGSGGNPIQSLIASIKSRMGGGGAPVAPTGMGGLY